MTKINKLAVLKRTLSLLLGLGIIFTLICILYNCCLYLGGFIIEGEFNAFFTGAFIVLYVIYIPAILFLIIWNKIKSKLSYLLLFVPILLYVLIIGFMRYEDYYDTISKQRFQTLEGKWKLVEDSGVRDCRINPNKAILYKLHFFSDGTGIEVFGNGENLPIKWTKRKEVKWNTDNMYEIILSVWFLKYNNLGDTYYQERSYKCYFRPRPFSQHIIIREMVGGEFRSVNVPIMTMDKDYDIILRRIK